MNDYDDDYLTGSFGQDPIKTTYQVGKGMLAHLLEVERQKEATTATALMEEEAEALLEDTSVVVPTPTVYMAEPDAEEIQTSEAEMPTPRRMQFQFEGDAA